MMDDRLAWLLESAARLNSGVSGMLSVRSVLAKLGIGFKKRIDSKTKHGAGVLCQDLEGSYYVVIKRPSSEPQPLSARERFTLAHEIGHVLLCERFKWNPTAGSEYYKCENWCDLFAAHLLVPDSVLPEIDLCSAKNALQSLDELSKKCKVSREVAARRIAEFMNGVGFFQARMSVNVQHKRVLQLYWGASSIPRLPLNRHLHLTLDHPLGKTLLQNLGKSNCNHEFLVEGLGDAYLHRRTAGLFVALVANAMIK